MSKIMHILGAGGRIGLAATIAFTLLMAVAVLLETAGPALAQDSGAVPGEALGNTSDSEFWRAVRSGEQGTVSIPDKQAAVMIQSEGEEWRNLRNGPISNFGGWVLIGTVVLLAAFFTARGRIKIDSGFSGKLIERFNSLERFAHWLTAGSFIILGITGLNTMYGRYLFGGAPATPGEFGIGHSFFAATVYYGKLAHNFLAFAFMLGLVLILVLWVKHNIPNALDLKWIGQAGGLFSKDVHPQAKKFNAGQKLIFWTVIVGGASMSLSGIALMFPYSFEMFGATFGALNAIGFAFPSEFTAIEEMQLSQLWHAIVAVVMIAIILAHIYIGSLGMEGAFDAMGNGMVDENWAREHHSLWVAEVKGEAPSTENDAGSGAAVTPAE